MRKELELRNNHVTFRSGTNLAGVDIPRLRVEPVAFVEPRAGEIEVAGLT